MHFLLLREILIFASNLYTIIGNISESYLSISTVEEREVTNTLFYMNARYSQNVAPVHRPRLLLCGERGQGQSSHLGPALLHFMEGLAVYVLDLPALYGISAKTPEESCAQVSSLLFGDM